MSKTFRWLIVVAALLALWVTPAPGQEPAAPKLDAAKKQAVVDQISMLLNQNYIFAETAKKMEEALRARLKSGDFDKLETAPAFAQAVSNTLSQVSKDGHIGFALNPALAADGPLPVYTPEATPTPVPDFTFVFEDLVQCVTIYGLKLLVTNTGEVPWESFSLHSENTTLHTTNTYSDNRFADCEACGCDTPATSIQPWQSNYVGSSASFLNHYPNGESFYVELTMCSQDGLGVLCLTKTLSFTVP